MHHARQHVLTDNMRRPGALQGVANERREAEQSSAARINTTWWYVGGRAFVGDGFGILEGNPRGFGSQLIRSI